MATAATLAINPNTRSGVTVGAGRKCKVRTDGVQRAAGAARQPHKFPPPGARESEVRSGGRGLGGSRSLIRGLSVRFCPDSGRQMKPGARTASPFAHELPLTCALFRCLPALPFPAF